MDGNVPDSQNWRRLTIHSHLPSLLEEWVIRRKIRDLVTLLVGRKMTITASHVVSFPPTSTYLRSLKDILPSIPSRKTSGPHLHTTSSLAHDPLNFDTNVLFMSKMSLTYKSTHRNPFNRCHYPLGPQEGFRRRRWTVENCKKEG